MHTRRWKDVFLQASFSLSFLIIIILCFFFPQVFRNTRIWISHLTLDLTFEFENVRGFAPPKKIQPQLHSYHTGSTIATTYHLNMFALQGPSMEHLNALQQEAVRKILSDTCQQSGMKNQRSFWSTVENSPLGMIGLFVCDS